MRASTKNVPIRSRTLPNSSTMHKTHQWPSWTQQWNQSVLPETENYFDHRKNGRTLKNAFIIELVMHEAMTRHHATVSYKEI